MKDKLTKPLGAALICLLLSAGVGTYVCIKAVTPLLKKPPKRAVDKDDPELKARGWDFWTIEIDNLANELQDQKTKLKKTSDELAQRAALLSSEEKELTKVRESLEKLRKDITDRVSEVRADESKNLRTLAQTYSALTPKAAVAILREMDDATVVKILSLMKIDVVGGIFEEMAKTPSSDGGLSRRAAILSERIRVLKASKTGQ